jgi:hypothetical protein
MDRAMFVQQERSLYRHNRLNPLIGSQPIVTPGLEPSLTFERASGKWLEKWDGSVTLRNRREITSGFGLIGLQRRHLLIAMSEGHL